MAETPPDRVLPHDLTAERAVLGAIMLEPTMFDVAEGTGLRAAQFFRDAHRQILEAMQRVRAAGDVPDFVTLRSDLEREKQIENVGIAYLAGLVDGVPRALNVEGYARIVREKAQIRDLIFAANKTLADAYAAGDDAEVLLDQAEARIMAIGREAARGEFVVASDWMTELWGQIDKATSEPRAVSGVPSGLVDLDRLTRGWQPADLVVIAGRPSDGKTSLMMQFANEASRHCFVGVCSLEMSRQAVGIRLVALEARVDAFMLMTGQLREHEVKRVGDALQRLSERRLAIDDAAGQTVAGLCAKVRRLASRYGIGIVFVDYLQLLHGGDAENRTQEITQITGRLKALAKELGVPVVALSQLTRDNARQGAGKRPELHNLRDGGSIEQDADVVVLIHRPNKSSDSARFAAGEEVEIILAKQRNGPAPRTVSAIWDGPTMRFADKTMEPTQPEQGRLA